MPLLNARLIRQMCEQPGDFDVVVPVWRGELQPLHAIYSKRCVPWIEKRLLQRNLKFVVFFPRVSILRIEEDLWKDLDPDGLSFMNINTQAELRQAQLRWDRLALERHEQAVPEVVS
jgi:molybdopterin-guanine dinucleotide biosynthesis protein A